MRKLVLIAAMLMASASAHAGNFSFNVEGQKVQVAIPRGCSSLSCINVTAPGLMDKFNKKEEDTATTSTPATTATAPAQAPAAAPAPAPAQQAVAPAPATAPAAETPAPVASSKITVLPPPTENTSAPVASAPSLTAPQVSLPAPAPAQVAAPAPAPAPTQMAAAPVYAPAPAPAAVQASNSPIGLWMAEKNEGKIVIEACGNNLCGWGIEKDGSKSAKMVLINMKPSGEKWVGRVHDTRGGGTYDSNIQLRGSDRLRVTGCMMMFCQGQTWTRIQ